MQHVSTHTYSMASQPVSTRNLVVLTGSLDQAFDLPPTWLSFVAAGISSLKILKRNFLAVGRHPCVRKNGVLWEGFMRWHLLKGKIGNAQKAHECLSKPLPRPIRVALSILSLPKAGKRATGTP